MYAVIRADGHQHRVTPGETVRLAKQQAQVGEKIQLSEVLIISQGGQTLVGKPLVEEACVEAKVVRHGRAKKIRVYTFKRRKGYSKTRGHRQDYTDVRIERFSLGGIALEPERAEQPEPQPAPAPEKAPEEALAPQAAAVAAETAPQAEAPESQAASAEQPAKPKRARKRAEKKSVEEAQETKE